MSKELRTAEQRPKLKPGCRIGPGGDVLLIPEGALRLQGPGTRIVGLCDGEKSVAEIVAILLAAFPEADVQKISDETNAFLARLADRGVIEFV